MGASNQREQQQNSQVSHLTSDPHYQQILRQLYANNSHSIANEFPQFQSNFRYNPHRHRADVEIKKTTPIKNDLFIHKKSLKMIKTSNPTILGLTFIFDSTSEVSVQVFYAATEYLTSNNITTKHRIENVHKQPSLPFYSSGGANKVFDHSSWPLDLTKFHLSQLTQIDQSINYYPLIIKMTPKQEQNEKPKGSQYLYAQFSENKENILNVDVKKIKIEKNNRAFIANDVYGGSSDAAQDDLYYEFDRFDREEKECAICLTEKIDTMIIPCKHMCLCQQCCADLRVRAQKCPICRRTIERFILVDRAALRPLSQAPQVQPHQEQKEEQKESDEQQEEKKEEQKEDLETTKVISTAVGEQQQPPPRSDTYFVGKGVLIGSSES